MPVTFLLVSERPKEPAHCAVIHLYLDKGVYFPGCSEADIISTLAPGDLFSDSMLNKSTGARVFMLPPSEHPGKCSVFTIKAL